MKGSIILSIIILVGFIGACTQTGQDSSTLNSSNIRTDYTSEPVGKVLVRLGDSVITDSEIEAKKKSLRFSRKNDDEIIEETISNRLLYLAAIKDGLDKDPQIRARLQEQIERLLGQMYINREIASLGISDEQLKSYYDEHKADFAIPERAIIAHIQLASEKEATDLLKKLQENEINWPAAAREYSTDKNTSKNDGRLGTVIRGQFIPIIGTSEEITDAIFAAEPGSIIGPFETPKGYHLIQVSTKTASSSEPFEKVKRQIVDILSISDEEINNYYEEVKDKRFKRKAFIKVKHIQVKSKAEADAMLSRLQRGESFTTLVHEKSIDTVSAKNDGDLGIIYDDGYVPRIGLDKEFVAELFKLEPGAISPVLKSNKGFHIVHVYEKKPEEYHDLDSVRNSVVNMLASSKRVEKRNELMKNLEETFKVERIYKEESDK